MTMFYEYVLSDYLCIKRLRYVYSNDFRLVEI